MSGRGAAHSVAPVSQVRRVSQELDLPHAGPISGTQRVDIFERPRLPVATLGRMTPRTDFGLAVEDPPVSQDDQPLRIAQPDRLQVGLERGYNRLARLELRGQRASPACGKPLPIFGPFVQSQATPSLQSEPARLFSRHRRAAGTYSALV